ncbi:MAG: hypothetical protein WD873_03890 [Candidatus Hydrogenedentales bacterium]
MEKHTLNAVEHETLRRFIEHQGLKKVAEHSGLSSHLLHKVAEDEDHKLNEEDYTILTTYLKGHV